jgi:hypothetical protein
VAPVAGGWLGFKLCSLWQKSWPARGDFGVITETPLSLVTSTIAGLVTGMVAGLILAGRLWPDRWDDQGG